MKKTSFPPMHFALIAAGEGSRLREEGVCEPKPLVCIQGLPMIERLIRIFVQNGARSFSVICNEQMKEVQEYLEALKQSDVLRCTYDGGETFLCPLNVVVQTTPSSMHSLAALQEVIPPGKFCLTTVDTIFREEEFASFIRSFAGMEECDGDGLFAVTPFVDDEKPLWVATRSKKSFLQACASQESALHDEKIAEIVGFYDREEQMPADTDKMVSGGIYCLDTRTAFPVLQACLAQGQSRMRNFQRALIASDLRLKSYVFPKIMDIDHAADIAKAEAWLSSCRKADDAPRMLAIARDERFSPNNESKDAAVFRAVIQNLEQQGWKVDSCSEIEWVKMEVQQVWKDYQQIIHMSRRMRSLMRLEQAAIPVWNTPHAVRTVAKSRELTLSLLEQAGVRVPRWWAYEPEEDEMFLCEPTLQQLLPGWVKAMREDGARAEDVTFVQTPLETDTCILRLASENVPDIVVTRHEDGELIKCYVVLDSDAALPRLLRWFRPMDSGYTKFGDAERHNTKLEQLTIDEASLATLAAKIGAALGLQIFGFDAIVRPDKEVVVIDVNDWPSFSICQTEAAEAIASVIGKPQVF